MNLIAQLEAEQIAELGKEIPDFKAGDTIRVGYKVTEGTARASPALSPFARFPLVKAWNVYSRCIPPTSTASPLCVVAAFVAPSCTTSAHAVVSPHVSLKRPTIVRCPAAQTHKDWVHEKRYSPRLSHHRRQNDRWHSLPDEIHLGRRRRPAFAGHRPLGSSRMDRRRRAPVGHRWSRIQVQEKVRRSGLLKHRMFGIENAAPSGRRFSLECGRAQHR